MSARRMPCKRCHHPRPVGTDGYCPSCAEILRRMKLPKSVPPEASIVAEGANEMDAPDGPRCACGKPSAFEDGSCVDCAVDGAKRVDDWAKKLAGDLVDAGEVERDALAAGAHEGDPDPITERSSKVPTLPPLGPTCAPDLTPSTAAVLSAESAAALQAVFPPSNGEGETVTYVAKNGDPDLAVLVSKPASVPPSLMGVTVNVTSLEVQQNESDAEGSADGLRIRP